MPDLQHYRYVKGKIACMQKNCEWAAVYWVWKPGVVNRYFCGWHTLKYWRANRGQVFANKLLGKPEKEGLPFRITVVAQAVNYLNRADKERLSKYGHGNW